MLSSSSWQGEEVIKYRQELFADWVKNGQKFRETLPEFHLTQPSNMKEWAPLVERELVHTKSICQIILQANSAKFAYLQHEDIFSPFPSNQFVINIKHNEDDTKIPANA